MKSSTYVNHGNEIPTQNHLTIARHGNVTDLAIQTVYSKWLGPSLEIKGQKLELRKNFEFLRVILDYMVNKWSYPH